MKTKPFHATITTKPAPIKTIEPDASSAHGMLLVAAEALYGMPQELTPEAQEITSNLVTALLDAASAVRFSQVDILDTLLKKCEITQRTLEMAHRACDAIDFYELQDIFERVGLGGVIDWSLS